MMNPREMRWVRFLAVGVVVHAAIATHIGYAIVINDDYFAASGGDPTSEATVAATIDAGFADAREFSFQDQFLSVGTIGQCTATWIGNDADADNSYFLTAAHCIEPDPKSEQFPLSETFIDWNGNTVATGAGTGYIPPERVNVPSGFGGSSTDIALIELPGQVAILDDAGELVEQPLIYDGQGELGAVASLAGYGSWGIGSFGSNGGLFPSSGARRAGGTNVVSTIFESEHALRVDLNPPGTGDATTLEAGVAPGDSGSAWWQEHGGFWSVIATTCCTGGTGYGGFSNGTRVSKYADWIESVFPDMQRWTEADPTIVTLTPGLASDDKANGVLGQYFTVEASGGAVTQIGLQRAPDGSPLPDSVYIHVYEDVDFSDGVDAASFVGASLSAESLAPTDAGFTFWDFDGTSVRLDANTPYSFAFASSPNAGDTVAARVALHNGEGASGYGGGFAPVDFSGRQDLNTIFQIRIDTDALNGVIGDVNQDGVVDFQDVSDFVAGWRSDTTGLNDVEKSMLGDLNLDNVTSLRDAFILHQSLESAGLDVPFGVLTGAVVPEPLSAIHASILWGALLMKTKRRRTGRPAVNKSV